MEIYKVQESDLIGGTKDFPIEVVQKMVERQYEQTGKCDVAVFQEKPDSGISFRGFNWGSTKEDEEFWNQVIDLKNFELFFDRYPKHQIQKQEEEDCWFKPEGVRMLVWNDSEDTAKEAIVIAKLPKGAPYPYLCVDNGSEEDFKNGNHYYIELYKNAKPLPKQTELTLQEIADKFGLKVDEIKIV